jgi:hypothetical protein
MKNVNAFLFALVLLPLGSKVQIFEPRDPGSFNIQLMNTEDSTRLGFKYVFGDISGNDGLDLVIMGIDYIDTSFYHPSILAQIRYFIEYQENTGSKTEPLFSPRTKIFEQYEYAQGTSFWIPDMADLNGDGRMDFVVSAFADSMDFQYIMFYMQNEDGGFNRTLCEDWGLNKFPPLSLFIPKLIDLDLDGDLDLLLCGYYNFDLTDENPYYTFLYAKNIGTPQSPEFLGWFENPYGLKPSGEYLQILTGGDIDLDGDIDILSFGNTDNGTLVQFYENTGGPGNKPAFAPPIDSPLGLPIPAHRNDDYLFPSLIDIDGDGDLDLFIPHYIRKEKLWTLDYFENQLCSEDINFLNEIICEGESLFVDGQEFSEAGEYEITTILSDRCKRTTFLYLEVIPAITVYIEETFCHGESYFFGDEEITESGTYEFSFASSSGCDSTVIATLNFIRIDTEVKVTGSVLKVKQDPDYFYQWFDCTTQQDIAGAKSHELDVPYSGSFGVRISHSWGCEEVSECHFAVASGTEFNPAKELILLPNPNSGTFQLINNSGYRINSVEIWNVKGKKIRYYQRPDNMIIIQNASDGIYYVIIDTGERKVVKKILVIN